MRVASCGWLIMRMDEPMLFPTYQFATALGIPNHFWNGESTEDLSTLSQHKVLLPIIFDVSAEGLNHLLPYSNVMASPSTHTPGDVKSTADVIFRPAGTGSTSRSTLITAAIVFCSICCANLAAHHIVQLQKRKR